MHIKHLRPVLLVFGLVILGLTLSVMLRQTFSKNVPSVETPQPAPKELPFKLTSPVFDTGGPIPLSHTCAENAPRIPLSIVNAPSNTKEFALVVRDTNNKSRWVVWDIPASTTLLSENTLPDGTVEGTNDEGSTKYESLCPKDNAKHTYTFELYALSDGIKLEPSVTRDGLLAAMNGKVITKVQLSGTVEAPAKPATAQ